MTRKINDKTIIPMISKKTIEYINKGHSENQMIIEDQYNLDLIRDNEIQLLRKYLEYEIKNI